MVIIFVVITCCVCYLGIAFTRIVLVGHVCHKAQLKDPTVSESLTGGRAYALSLSGDFIDGKMLQSSTGASQSGSKKNKIGNERDEIFIHFAFGCTSCRDWFSSWFLSVSNFLQVWRTDCKPQVTLAWLHCCSIGAGVSVK